MPRTKLVIQNILEDNTHRIYRIAESSGPRFILCHVTVGVPYTMMEWAWAGILSALLAPIIITSLIIIYHNIPKFSYELIGAIMAFLIGEKAIIFQDSYLMKYWNYFMLILTGFLGAYIIGLMVVQLKYFPLISFCMGLH